MKQLTFKDIERTLLAHDFELVRQKGSHCIYRNQAGQMVSVPKRPGRKPLKLGTVRAIIKQSGLNPKNFI